MVHMFDFVAKCHACHAKCRGITSCAWKRVCDKVVCERWCVTKLCERWCVTKLCVKDGVWQSCVWKMVCDKVVWKMMCDKVVCERWCVTKLCVKDGVWQSCVRKMVCDKEAAEVAWRRPDGYRIKNKNPTQRCGEKEIDQTRDKGLHAVTMPVAGACAARTIFLQSGWLGSATLFPGALTQGRVDFSN